MCPVNFEASGSREKLAITWQAVPANRAQVSLCPWWASGLVAVALVPDGIELLAGVAGDSADMQSVCIRPQDGHLAAGTGCCYGPPTRATLIVWPPRRVRRDLRRRGRPMRLGAEPVRGRACQRQAGRAEPMIDDRCHRVSPNNVGRPATAHSKTGPPADRRDGIARLADDDTARVLAASAASAPGTPACPPG